MCILARLTKPGFFMLSRRQIQFITSLQQKKFRKEYQRFIAEGSKLVEELLHSQLEIESIYATKTWLDNNSGLIENRKVEAVIVTEKELSRISTLKTANQALAVLQIPSPVFDPAIAQLNPC
jgi:RNA methyltransferase, TrmH family